MRDCGGSAGGFRVSVSGNVLLIHQTIPPEPNCLNLPRGELESQEAILEGWRREIWEETGLEQLGVRCLDSITGSRIAY
ncbi:NUDIX hydrolase [Leptolyngbya ohadii]|uniref:NUDIX hydrolase n=1 Tax=Leptolyngbya ohadii TaxID=1962290 RepID=UPI000B599E60|nr:NUDIX hydrolase [Leptolyngbya ohadii]